MEEFLWTQTVNISLFIGILLATFVLAFFVGRFLKRTIKRSSENMEFDPTNYHFLRHSIVAVIYVVGVSAAVSQVPSLSKLTNSLLAGAGILAVAVGFAAQHALSNVISGVFIVLFKPFKIKDRISLKDKTLSGVIEDITLRHVVIRDYENRRIIVPNTIISDEIIVNADFVDEGICKWINISISYDSDLQLAKKIILEEALQHPLRIDKRTPEQITAGNPEVSIRVINLGESSVDLRAWTWAANQADAFALGCDLFESIKLRFDKEGIEIPYPHRTIVQKK